MKTKLKSILLVDDDKATNFLHELILKDLNCAESIYAVRGGDEALDFLTEKGSNGFAQPDLILLDINMPGMDGWMFLDEYDKLPDSQKAVRVIVMLTSSLNPDDKAKAAERKIKGFMNKPLTDEKALKMIKDNFPDRF